QLCVLHSSSQSSSWPSNSLSHFGPNTSATAISATSSTIWLAATISPGDTSTMVPSLSSRHGLANFSSATPSSPSASSPQQSALRLSFSPASSPGCSADAVPHKPSPCSASPSARYTSALTASYP